MSCTCALRFDRRLPCPRQTAAALPRLSHRRDCLISGDTPHCPRNWPTASGRSILRHGEFAHARLHTVNSSNLSILYVALRSLDRDRRVPILRTSQAHNIESFPAGTLPIVPEDSANEIRAMWLEMWPPCFRPPRSRQKFIFFAPWWTCPEVSFSLFRGGSWRDCK